MPAAFRVFKWEPSPEQVRFICSGRGGVNRGVPGDLVVISSPRAKVLADDLGSALKEIKGRSLSALLKRAKVNSAEALADLPHAELQAAKPASKPARTED